MEHAIENQKSQEVDTESLPDNVMFDADEFFEHYITHPLPLSKKDIYGVEFNLRSETAEINSPYRRAQMKGFR